MIVARHPCIMNLEADKKRKPERMEVTDDCIGCQVCFQDFECPAIGPDPETGMASIDQTLCSACGVCIQVCPQGSDKRDAPRMNLKCTLEVPRSWNQRTSGSSPAISLSGREFIYIY